MSTLELHCEMSVKVNIHSCKSRGQSSTERSEMLLGLIFLGTLTYIHGVMGALYVKAY